MMGVYVTTTRVAGESGSYRRDEPVAPAGALPGSVGRFLARGSEWDGGAIGSCHE
jgi:hypothetical protein